MNIGFYGCGTMGTAYLHALVRFAGFLGHDFIVCTKTERRHADLQQKYSVTCTTDVKELSGCDILVLGVKPQYFLAEHVAFLKPKWVISLMAKIDYDQLASVWPESDVIRLMPNLAVAFNKGVTGIFSKQVISEEIKLVLEAGSMPVYAEKELILDEVTRLAGCGPGVLAKISEWICEGVGNGISMHEKKAIWTQTVMGFTDLAQHYDNFNALYADVASKGGVTEGIVKNMAENGAKEGILGSYGGKKG